MHIPVQKVTSTIVELKFHRDGEIMKIIYFKKPPQEDNNDKSG